MRRLILQIHLWSALICGAYVILISVTGSAVVLRREFGRWFSPPSFIEVGESRLSDAEISATIGAAWPAFEVVSVGPGSSERVPVPVTLVRGERTIERRVNPYTGEDLGDPFPWQLELMSWLVDLHDNLLSGPTGRRVNGVGGLAFMLIIVTGAILWWPRGLWRRSVTFSFREHGIAFLWRLHSSIGFWSLPLLLIWGVTAAYFGFPEPVEQTIDYFDPDPTDFERPGEGALLTLIAAHFGRFGPLPVRFIWMTAGMVPVVLFVSGFLMWLRRRQPRASGR
ncbi:MAG TPA: PepSY-associated TM helix domain-containing protein [Gammaproteobacteria bacterium]|nr:PepSY-associated TM helix domain-containing protein [Gammaproteobacteria bacterium]